jgi:hypothetical protein
MRIFRNPLLLLLIMTAGILALTMPAFAQYEGNISITGTIQFPVNNVDNLKITDLTIYAVNEKTKFGGSASPAEDGAFNIKVASSGNYIIKVFPAEIVLDKGVGYTNVVQYPDGSSRMYVIFVPESGVKGLNINYNAPGSYKPPEVVTPAPTKEPSPQATATPKPTSTPAPGFILAAALMMLALAAICLKRK